LDRLDILKLSLEGFERANIVDASAIRPNSVKTYIPSESSERTHVIAVEAPESFTVNSDLPQNLVHTFKFKSIP